MEVILKLDIIRKILNTDDDVVLKQIKDLLDSVSNNRTGSNGFPALVNN